MKNCSRKSVAIFIDVVRLSVCLWRAAWLHKAKAKIKCVATAQPFTTTTTTNTLGLWRLGATIFKQRKRNVMSKNIHTS